MISTFLLTEKDRETLLRFVISVGERMSTLVYNCTEWDNDGHVTKNVKETILTNSAKLSECQVKKQEYLSGKVDKELFPNNYLETLECDISMCERSVKENKMFLERLKNRKPLAQKYIDFCKSFNFVENNKYYKFDLTQEQKDFIARECVFGDCGNMALGVEPWVALRDYSSVVFEDIEVYCNGKNINIAVSHEEYFEVEFDDALKEKFIDFENQRDRNLAILNMLEKSHCPQDLKGSCADVILNDDAVILNIQDGRTVKFDFAGYKRVISFDKISGKQNVEFANGDVYILDDIDLAHNVQGHLHLGENLNYCYSELILTLKTQKGEYCVIVVDADKIFVDVI